MTTVTVSFRIPAKVHAAASQLAAANRRSLNAEVVIAIEEHLAAHATRRTALAVAKAITTTRKHVARAKGGTKR